MDRVKHTNADGITSEHWRGIYNNCPYFYDCSDYNELDANIQFYVDVRNYRIDRFMPIDVE